MKLIDINEYKGKCRAREDQELISTSNKIQSMEIELKNLRAKRNQLEIKLLGKHEAAKRHIARQAEKLEW